MLLVNTQILKIFIVG